MKLNFVDQFNSPEKFNATGGMMGTLAEEVIQKAFVAEYGSVSDCSLVQGKIAELNKILSGTGTGLTDQIKRKLAPQFLVILQDKASQCAIYGSQSTPQSTPQSTSQSTPQVQSSLLLPDPAAKSSLTSSSVSAAGSAIVTSVKSNKTIFIILAVALAGGVSYYIIKKKK